jgi:hypothetical protein
MIRIAGAPFALFAFVVALAFAKSSTAPEVIFISPCECQGFHGKNRWIAKTDLTPVPLDKSAIQSVTPLLPDYGWPVGLLMHTAGDVVAIIVESDELVTAFLELEVTLL